MIQKVLINKNNEIILINKKYYFLKFSKFFLNMSKLEKFKIIAIAKSIFEDLDE